MTAFIVDFLLLAAIVIGLTALNGILTNVFGMKILGRGQVDRYTTKSAATQTGWRKVGGKS
ncbi:hypothetical protein [Bacillus alkalicellulosilyticus]|uniref:hypothetical protein n=1 Tax=Alkalihalobacterium alkalicellulosilyticum TaxID=1912214 RepID=UPI000996C724|nr:hypothetical protein [Bacillus alkalicellulosilyticus]